MWLGDAKRVLVTVHPAAIARLADDGLREAAFRTFVEDLRMMGAHV